MSGKVRSWRAGLWLGVALLGVSRTAAGREPDDPPPPWLGDGSVGPSLSLAGRFRTINGQLEQGRETAVFAMLTWPLDALWRPLGLAGTAPAPDDDSQDQADLLGLDAADAEFGEQLEELEGRTGESRSDRPRAPGALRHKKQREAQTGADEAAAEAPPEATRAEAGADTEQGSSEPRVERQRPLQISIDTDLMRDTTRAALRVAGYGATRSRLASLSSRARSSAALPELRLSGGRSTDQSLRLSPTTSDPYRYSRSGGTDLFFEARATWKLDRLMFAREELQVERLRASQAKERLQLIERVVELLFAWQRGRIVAADDTLPMEERLEATLVSIEAELALDVLTDGWFARRLARDGLSSGNADE